MAAVPNEVSPVMSGICQAAGSAVAALAHAIISLALEKLMRCNDVVVACELFTRPASIVVIMSSEK